MDKIEEAVQRIVKALEQEAEPRRMTQAEAVDFYQGVAVECKTWVNLIRQDMKKGL